MSSEEHKEPFLQEKDLYDILKKFSSKYSDTFRCIESKLKSPTDSNIDSIKSNIECIDPKSRLLEYIIGKLNLNSSGEGFCVEGGYLEFKKISDSEKNGSYKRCLKDLRKSIMAMLNSGGGLICVGFEECSGDKSGDKRVKYYKPVGFENDGLFKIFKNDVIEQLNNKCIVYVDGKLSKNEVDFLLGKGEKNKIKKFKKPRIHRVWGAKTEISHLVDSFFIESWEVSDKTCAFIFIPPLLKSYKPAFIGRKVRSATIRVGDGDRQLFEEGNDKAVYDYFLNRKVEEYFDDIDELISHLRKNIDKDALLDAYYHIMNSDFVREASFELKKFINDVAKWKFIKDSEEKKLKLRSMFSHIAEKLKFDSAESKERFICENIEYFMACSSGKERKCSSYSGDLFFLGSISNSVCSLFYLCFLLYVVRDVGGRHFSEEFENYFNRYIFFEKHFFKDECCHLSELLEIIKDLPNLNFADFMFGCFHFLVYSCDLHNDKRKCRFYKKLVDCFLDPKNQHIIKRDICNIVKVNMKIHIPVISLFLVVQVELDEGLVWRVWRLRKE